MDAELLLFVALWAMPSALLVLWMGRLFGLAGAIISAVTVVVTAGVLAALSEYSLFFEYPTLIGMCAGFGSLIGCAVFTILRKTRSQVTSIREQAGDA